MANLVKEGKTNKEIAELLCISKNTVLFHRHNIRQKLGLKNKKINLRTHLLSYDNQRLPGVPWDEEKPWKGPQPRPAGDR